MKMASRLFLLEDSLCEDSMERDAGRRETRESLNVNIIPDFEFIRNYRLTRSLFQSLCEEIIPLMSSQKNTRGLDPVVKVCNKYLTSFYPT